MKLRGVLLVAAIASGACASDHAPDTNQLVIVLRIDQPEGAGPTRYQATFSLDGLYRKLDVGDEVRVTADAAPPVVLSGDDYYLGETYSFERDDPPFTSATFALSRVRGGTAPSSVASFAPALADFTPPDATSLAYRDGTAPVTMRWTNALPEAFITYVSHACDHADNHVESKQLPDKGAIVLPLRDILIDGTPKAPTCVRVEIRRALPGKLDPVISSAGSTVTGYLVHATTLTITP